MFLVFTFLNSKSNMQRAITMIYALSSLIGDYILFHWHSWLLIAFIGERAGYKYDNSKLKMLKLKFINGYDFRRYNYSIIRCKRQTANKIFFSYNEKKNSSPIYVNNFHNTTTKNLLNVLGYLPVFRYQRMTTYLQGSILIVK